jgi:hypothetical protein
MPHHLAVGIVLEIDLVFIAALAVASAAIPAPVQYTSPPRRLVLPMPDDHGSIDQ